MVPGEDHPPNPLMLVKWWWFIWMWDWVCYDFDFLTVDNGCDHRYCIVMIIVITIPTYLYDSFGGYDSCRYFHYHDWCGYDHYCDYYWYLYNHYGDLYYSIWNIIVQLGIENLPRLWSWWPLLLVVLWKFAQLLKPLQYLCNWHYQCYCCVYHHYLYHTISSYFIIVMVFCHCYKSIVLWLQSVTTYLYYCEHHY